VRRWSGCDNGAGLCEVTVGVCLGVACVRAVDDVCCCN
jgi:hypothetical protein